MANMSYCQFENTAGDLQDCYDNMDEKVEGSEAKARERLIKLCVDIACDYGHEVGRECEEV